MFFKKKFLPEGSLSAKSWLKLRKNKTAVFSMLIIAFAAVVCILGYLITPDSTPFANDQHLETAACKPGFRVLQILIRNNEPARECSLLKKLAYGCPADYTTIPINHYYFRANEIVLTPYDKAGYEGDSTLTLVFKLSDVIYALTDTTNHATSAVQLKDMDGKPVIGNIREMQQIILNDHLVKKPICSAPTGLAGMC